MGVGGLSLGNKLVASKWLWYRFWWASTASKEAHARATSWISRLLHNVGAGQVFLYMISYGFDPSWVLSPYLNMLSGLCWKGIYAWDVVFSWSCNFLILFFILGKPLLISYDLKGRESLIRGKKWKQTEFDRFSKGEKRGKAEELFACCSSTCGFLLLCLDSLLPWAPHHDA